MNREMKLREGFGDAWAGWLVCWLTGCAVGDGDGDDEKRCPWGPETGKKLKLVGSVAGIV